MPLKRNFTKQLYLDCSFHSNCHTLACPLDIMYCNFKGHTEKCILSKEARVALALTNKGTLKLGGLTHSELEKELNRHRV